MDALIPFTTSGSLVDLVDSKLLFHPQTSSVKRASRMQQLGFLPQMQRMRGSYTYP